MRQRKSPFNSSQLLERIRQLDQENTNLCKAFSEDTGKQLARIKELEEKLRWRDCKTEPPTEDQICIVRVPAESKTALAVGVKYAYFNGFILCGEWVLVGGEHRKPHEWRPI